MGLLLFLVGIGILLLKGVILQDLWSWFVVPFGIVELTYAWALGIVITVSLLTFQFTYATKNTNEEIWTNVISATFVYLIVWGLGAIIAQFM